MRMFRITQDTDRPEVEILKEQLLKAEAEIANLERALEITQDVVVKLTNR